jgi:ZIP family zinc transporter
VNVWAALGWGAFSSASLFLGQLLARPMADKHRATGQVMGFGAGTMLSAVAYELIPETSLSHGLGIGISLGLGAITYFIGDRIVDGSGGAERQSIDAPTRSGSGAAMFLGALLDGVPEAFVLGITLETGGGVSVAFVAAVFVSNIPQGIAGTTSLLEAGATNRRVTKMWGALTIGCALVAAAGFLLADTAHVEGLYSEAFAAGAVLTMLADSMMPEAFEHGGKPVGLYTVFGYAVAAALTIAS